jgi:Flp pilus assembly protein TadG
MIRRIIRDEHGGAIVEGTITMLLFLLLTLGITQAGLIVWSAVGLEHGTELAARCASVSDAAIAAGFTPSASTPTLCPGPGGLAGVYTTDSPGAANNASTVEAYAANNSWGVGVPSSAFSTPSGSCPSPSNQVSSSFSWTLMNFLFESLQVSALSCYATNS